LKKNTKGDIVTFGIVPTKPETGWYIERKEMTFLLGKTQSGFSLGFYSQMEFFFGIVKCFVSRWSFAGRIESLSS
jgi:hypothetical protein